jgi:hypothetical protein
MSMNSVLCRFLRCAGFFGCYGREHTGPRLTVIPPVAVSPAVAIPRPKGVLVLRLGMSVQFGAGGWAVGVALAGWEGLVG